MRRRSAPLKLLLSLFILFVGGSTTSGFKICAYHVEQLNQIKAKTVMHRLTQIVSRCDITLLQEVIDPNGYIIKTLLAALNRETDRYDEFSYKAVSSEGLGNDKQQYVFIYRTDTVSVVSHDQYQKKQAFVRNPFAVQFQSNKTAVKTFVCVALHTEPKQAVQEIDRLYDVFQELSRKWNNMDMMFLGDFHAGCAYMTRADKKKIRMFSSSKFFWLIGDKVDTTLSDETNCAYDRIVVHGKSFLKAITPLSAKVTNIAKELRLTRSKVQELSRHLPVEVHIKSSAHLCQATPLLLLLTASAIVQYFLSAL